MLQEHCREEHNGTGCFECNLCGARVMTKLSLKRHIRSHSGLKAATCSVSCRPSEILKMIYSVLHAVVAFLHSQICGKTFKRADYLATHYKLHEGTRTHLCGVCGKEFASNTSLKLHEKVSEIEYGVRSRNQQEISIRCVLVSRFNNYPFYATIAGAFGPKRLHLSTMQ